MAVRWRLIDHNVCKEVRSPRVPAPEIRPFSLEEAKRFLAAAESDQRYHALYVLGLTTGARWGEHSGLYYSDLDLDCRVMHIQHSLINAHGGLALDTPKTKGSVRSVGLTVKATEALIRHRGTSNSRRATCDRRCTRIHQQGWQAHTPTELHPPFVQTSTQTCRSTGYELARGYAAYLYVSFTAGPCEPQIRSLAGGMVISRVHVGELREISTGMGRRRSYGQAALIDHFKPF
jgi:integrase